MSKFNFFVILNQKIPLELSLFFSIIFLLGLIGVLFKRNNFLLTMLSIEIMYIGVICFSLSTFIICYITFGQTCALIFLIIAACESAVGLGALILLFRFGKSLEYGMYEELRG